MKYFRLVFFIGICCNLGITVSIILLTFHFQNTEHCTHSMYNLANLEQLSIEHSSIFVSIASFPKLKHLENCSFHPNFLKISMRILLERFSEIYNSSCILRPPLLVSTLDFYIGSYSISLRRNRLHLTFIDCYPERECYGSYENVLNQQAFPTDLIKTYSQNSTHIVKSLLQHDKRQFSCIFQWNYGQHISEMQIVNTKMGGSAYCLLSTAIVDTAKQKKMTLKVLIVSRELHNVYILCKINLNLFDLNLPLSIRNTDKRPFKLFLACAPLTWSQIKTNILLEWIVYHKLIGVEHFLIYIKETDISNVQNIVQYLKPLINNHTITLINWQFGAFSEPENAFQIPQMIDAIQRTADYSVWIMIADTDEFFYAEHHETLTEILDSYQEIAEQNLTISHRQELTIQNVHMMQSLTQMNSHFITGKYFKRCRATKHPLRSKIIAYSGSDRFLAAEEVHFFSKDATFVPKQLMRLNHYFNAYNKSRKPVEKIYYVGEDTSLWQAYGAQIQENFQDYLQKSKTTQTLESLNCVKNIL